MEAHQRLQRLFGDALQPGAHLGFADHAEPAVAILVEVHGLDRAGALLAVDLELLGHEHRRIHGLQPVDQRQQRGRLVFEALQGKHPLDHRGAALAALVAFGGEGTEGNPPSLPQAVAQQPQQKQKLGGAGRIVQRQEPARALVGPPQITGQPVLEDLFSCDVELRQDPADEGVEHVHPHRRRRLGAAPGQIVFAVAAVLGQVEDA